MLRYGVVGVGRVFTRMHLPCLAERPELELVAACDVDADRASADLTTAGVDVGDLLVTADLGTFLTEGRPDVVVVCTPNDAHAEPVRRAVDHGAAVLCEKPLAARLDDARTLAALAPAGPDRPFGVNLPYRLHPLLADLAQRIDGRAVRVSARFTTAGLRLWRPATAWYTDPARAGGGALVDLGPHVLDALGSVFGPASVRACRVDAVPEERVTLELDYGQGPATVVIDRASRRIGFTVEVQVQDGPLLTLDLRRGQLVSDGETTTTPDPQPELAAIRGFLAAVAGAPGAAVVTASLALPIEETIASALALAQVTAEE